MSGKRDDRRVQFTKMLLRQSMIKLLHEKPVAKVTIKELCESADINRGTFYAHFSDPIDLLHHTEEKAIEDISTYIEAFVTEHDTEAVKEASLNLCNYIKKEALSWRALLSEKGSLDFYKKLYDVGYNDFVSKTDQHSGEDAAAWKLMYTYILTGGLGMVMRWLVEENDQTPEQVADILFHMIKPDIDLLLLKAT